MNKEQQRDEKIGMFLEKAKPVGFAICGTLIFLYGLDLIKHKDQLWTRVLENPEGLIVIGIALALQYGESRARRNRESTDATSINPD